MSDFIAIEVQGIEELQAKLDKLPPEAADMGIEEGNKYLLAVFRQYPPQKYVSRKAAYGRTFESDKQRRYFFAALKDGRISVPYKRTQRLSRGWKKLGYGRNSFLANETPYAGLMQQKATQSRMAAKGGWEPIEDLIRERMPRLLQRFEGGVKKALRKLGL